jgi:L-alanine-DL-glutamate epimerase-like enolase superfamily enzyme
MTQNHLSSQSADESVNHRIIITDVTLAIVRWLNIEPAVYGNQNPPAGGESRIGLVTISTDAGIDGHAFLGSSFRPVDIDARAVIDVLKPLLIGENALDRDRLSRLLLSRTRAVMLRPVGALDVALWDIAGKAAGLPIYRLIGAAREKIPAYASSPVLASLDEYAEEAKAVRAAGYQGYKIHPPHDHKLHIPVLERVRDAVGDDFSLMYDASMLYKFPEAVKVGRALERLGFLWYEDPLPVEDLYNYTKLCAELDVAVMATEYSHGGFHGYAPWIAMKATDALRGDVAIKGGITPCLKSAHLAEAFHMNFELHHGGNSLNNVANLHVGLAIANCDYFEVLLPHSAQKFGLVTDIDIDADGCIAPFDAPGLGADIDFELLRHQTLDVLR